MSNAINRVLQAQQSSMFGWVPDRPRQNAFAADVGQLATVSPIVYGQPKEVELWRALQMVHPSWRRGAQGIGDCFAAGTIVMGLHDCKPIEDVCPGDHVFDGAGRVTKVVSHQAKVSHQPLLTIHSTGGMPLRVTADHRVLAYRFEFYDKQHKKRISKGLYERSFDRINGIPGGRGRPNAVVDAYESRKAEWVRAADLRESDYLLTPTSFAATEPIPSHKFLSDCDAMWMLGLWLGDGSASGGSVEFALSDEAITTRLDACLRRGGYRPKRSVYRKNCNAWRIRVHDASLVRWLRESFYGHDDLKLFPAWAAGNEDVIEGLLDADGSCDDINTRFDSASPSLAYGVYRSWVAAGLEPAIKEMIRSPKGSYDTQRKAYRVTYRRNRTRNRIWSDGSYLVNPITKIEAVEGPHVVYDIGVESDLHCFIADGHVAHNCVSWGAEGAATFLLAMQHLKGVSQWTAEAATESIYGGCRVEALGKQSGGWSDGAFGAAAAKWLRDWGVLLRLDYGADTGNREHDLTRYSKDRAKQWGNFGNGGRNDGGKLDEMAQAFPVEHVVQVKTGREIIMAVSNGYPVTIASMAGFGNMKRDANGVVRISGKWPHQMFVAGTRVIRGKWHGRIVQSWGDSCSGPDPGIDWDAMSACSWWATEGDLDQIARSGDCWAFSDIMGFPPQTIDFSVAAENWYQGDVRPSFELSV